MRLPTVIFAEGGGGRPGDTDYAVVSALDTRAFALWARLSGIVPRIAIVNGRCFAGNAVLAGASDLIVATESTALGMGGPAMVAGGGLGDFEPEAIGPLSVQAPNGVVDVAVADEAEAVAVTKRLLGYFQGSIDDWREPPGPALREVIPERRRRAYDVRAAIDGLADAGSVTHLRDGFARTMVTALARIEGRPVGIVANNPIHLAGAITSDGADKAARFMQLCDAFGLPIVSLIDTPGMMVGPDAEATGLVRHCSRLFVTGANLRVPLVAVVLRKAYGLGAQAMAGGGMHEPLLTVGWPSAELGAMGLEGAVRLGFRRELDAIADEGEREERIEAMVAAAHDHAKALNAATLFELDDVIDPADSRRVIASTLAAAAPVSLRAGALASSTPGEHPSRRSGTLPGRNERHQRKRAARPRQPRDEARPQHPGPDRPERGDRAGGGRAGTRGAPRHRPGPQDGDGLEAAARLARPARGARTLRPPG